VSSILLTRSRQTRRVSARLVPPETYAIVGESLGPPVSAVITRREAQRYARAVGDLDPVYFDEDAARAAGYDGVVAPPTFVGHAVVEGATLEDLREDGLWVDRGRKVRLAVSRTMFGGEEWEFRQPVLVGDTVTAQRRLGNVEEKDGRSGPFVLLHYETTFTNQRDEVVAISRLVGIAR
jgi:acyl dehydratase